MKNFIRYLSPVSIAIGLSFSAVPLCADGWPQWRGPHRDGISQETNLLKEWPANGPKLLWQLKEIGAGYSTPAVVGERLYIMNSKGMDDEFVQAFAVKDGKQIWSTRVGKVGPNEGPQYPASRATPTVEGEVLYALGSDGDLACVEIETGKIRWQKNLRAEFNGKPGNWAYSESPLLDGDALVCTPGGAEATLVALNKKSGAVMWRSAVQGADAAAYSSIIISAAGGLKHYVQFLQKGLVGVDASNGKVLWRYDKTAQGSPANIPTPVVHDVYVYSATGRGGGGLIKLNVNDGNVQAEQIYFSPKLPTSIGGAVKVGNHLYGTTSQGLLCADFMSGDVKWQERGVGAASLCYAEGRLYLHGENGELALVEATPQAYREKGRFTPPDQPDRGRSKAWAYPVIANRQLYIRDMGALWCYDIKAAQ